jgi:hypothetical protein
MIQFSATSYNVSEGAGSVTITVTRSGNTSGTASVQYATFDVSALSIEDYSVASGTLTFAAGETSKSFTVLIRDDAVREPTETFNVMLRSPSNATLGTPTTATVDIGDNDRKSRNPRISTRTSAREIKSMDIRTQTN